MADRLKVEAGHIVRNRDNQLRTNANAITGIII